MIQQISPAEEEESIVRIPNPSSSAAAPIYFF